MDIKKKALLSIMAFLMLSNPVLSVSAANTTDGEEGMTYHYFLKSSGKRYNTGGKYFTYNLSAEVEADRMLAAYWDPNSTNYKYDNYIICSLVNGRVYQVGSTNSLKVTSYDCLENTDVSNGDNYFTKGDSLSSFIIGNWAADKDGKYLNTVSATTNIPYFVDMESAKHYLETGDLTGNKNPYDPMDDLEEDATYAFTGFSAVSEGKTGNIEAKWTGTTHDKKSADYEKMEYYVNVGYSFAGEPNTVATVKFNLFGGNISEKGFTKLYSYFQPSHIAHDLYYLKVIPTYTFNGKSYKGIPCYIYFDVDGNVTKVDDNGAETSKSFDYDFELSDLQISNFSGISVVDKTARQIYWSSTTKDSLIKELGYYNTGVNVFCIGKNEETGKIEKISYESINSYFISPYVHQNFVTTSNSFDVSGSEIKSYMEKLNLKFDGFLYLEPYYFEGVIKYFGKISTVNIYSGDTSTIEPGESEDPPEVPDLPDDPNDSDLPDIDNIESPLDIFPYFFKLIKGFILDVGQIPMFFSYLFSFLPQSITNILEMSFLVVFILRILGR